MSLPSATTSGPSVPPASGPPGRGGGPGDEPVPVVLLVTWRMVVAGLLILFVAQAYARAYDPAFGWTRLIVFGGAYAERSLPRLQRQTHFAETNEYGRYGYDGQFYAQLAIDPSLRDPDMARAIDMPAYRARRIGLSATAFVLGWGKPRRILTAYALANALFWLVLLVAFCRLLRPRTRGALLCLAAATLCTGAVASMARSLVDLPAAALLFAGLAAGAGGVTGPAWLAAAALTRETGVLAVAGLWDGRAPWRDGGWKRLLGVVAAAVVPLGLWMLYVNVHLGHGTTTGVGNFGPPLQAIGERCAEQVHRLAALGGRQFWGNVLGGDWLWTHYATFELATILGLCFQGLFLVLRPDWRSPCWRVGTCYLLLGTVLGTAVWEDTSAAARVLLPMTICFYLQLARERPWWFWPFFLLGSLSWPYSLRQLWLAFS